MGTNPNPIHPVSQQMYAESPFLRKLKRIREDVAMARSIANISQGAQLELIMAELDHLINAS